MANHSTVLLVVVFLIIALTLLVLFLTLLRETLFWYWRNKGVVQPPQDILSKPHETALIIRKSIDLKKEEARRVMNRQKT
ncbi:MAG TPA: hypothetical protein VK465_03870 [Fibrobacteria bacterium]|nr:hypothetical protein [Fibrobacteria bacterium]